MTIYCKVDGTQFEPHASNIYCSFDCALKDCVELDENKCEILKKSIQWGDVFIRRSQNDSRRMVYKIVKGPLRTNDWLRSLDKSCSPYCISLNHCSVVDRSEFLKKQGQEKRKDPEFEAARIEGRKKYDKYGAIIKTQEKLNSMSDAELAQMMRAVFQTVAHELGVGDE